MAVLITNMAMPKTCYECGFVQHGGTVDWCFLKDELDINDGDTQRPSFCPLKEIKEHKLDDQLLIEAGFEL